MTDFYKEIYNSGFVKICLHTNDKFIYPLRRNEKGGGENVPIALMSTIYPGHVIMRLSLSKSFVHN